MVSPASPARFFEVDLLKAVGILTVVLIHSLRAPWDPGVSAGELWLGHVTRFAVPGFFAASGFLYATTRPIPSQLTRRRLLRVLIPYLIASLCAQLHYFLLGIAPESGPLWRQLLLCSSFGPYYFVLIFMVFVLCSPMLCKLESRHLPLLLGILFVVQLLLETGIIPPVRLFWHLRNPFLWAGYFVLGWWARLHYHRLQLAVASRRTRLVLLLGTAFVLLTTATALPWSRVAVGTLAWLGILTALALGFVAGAGRDRLPLACRRLSDSSYMIYLFHLFFLDVARNYVTMQRGVFEPGKLALIWSAGVLGSLGLLWAARRLLGERSRALIGA